jgi:hypothetical protein
MTAAPDNTRSGLTVTHVALVVVIVGIVITTVSFLPVRHSESEPFVSPAFQRTWVAEATAATRAVDLWGGEPLAWKIEPYYGAPNDRRVVQYFERGRMEVERGSSAVSQGLLVSELTRGLIDLGGGLATERQAPEISIDSGAADERVPTYLTLAKYVDRSPGDLTGDRITTWINREGVFERSSTPETRRFGAYVEATGHNLPDVTVDLFEQPEFQGGRWVESFGNPISEPLWTEYRRSDELRPALIQVFERRILVYSPHVEDSRIFSVPSHGRHYFTWRYGSEPHTGVPAIPPDAVAAGVSSADSLDAWTFLENAGTPIDMTLSATGHLMILNAEGQILRVDSPDPAGEALSVSVWAEGIEDPQGLVARGDTVAVTAGDRVWWYHDQDGQGMRSQAPELLTEGIVSISADPIRGKPVTTSGGEFFTRVDSGHAGEVLKTIGTGRQLLNLSDLLDRSGPLAFSSGDLFLTGLTEDGRPAIILVPSALSSASESEPQTIATFSVDTRIRAIAIVDEDHWALSEYGDVIVAVQDEETSRIFALSRTQRINDQDEVELVELARGFSRPTAIQVGLDGSLYVSDADTGRIVRIRYSE